MVEGVLDEEEESHLHLGTANASASSSGAPAQKKPSKRDIEVAIDCILGDALPDETGRPTLYRLALKTDYFSLGPAKPSPFLLIRAFVFGLVR